MCLINNDVFNFFVLWVNVAIYRINSQKMF